ncbi:MAG: site-2 protease family protein [Acidimicrobiales bacterium]|nr:site-2 protease family protein [Acidimicrobiales bacterium]
MNELRRNQLIALVLLVALVVIVAENHVISTNKLILFGVLFGSIVLHEVSHGVLALAFGDSTARNAGRLTLNPIAHIDPFGSIILPAILVLAGFGAFGWAKPVPVNQANMRSPRNQGLMVSLVGPAVNIVLAVIAALALRFYGRHLIFQSDPWWALFYLGYANVILAAFNLIPIPPLDGSAVIERMLPRAWWPRYMQLRMVSLPVIIFIVLLVPGVLGHIFNPALNWWYHLVQ